MSRNSQQIPAPAPGVHFIDPGMIPDAPPGAVAMLYVDLRGKVMAGAWVAPEYVGQPLLEGSWVWWDQMSGVATASASASPAAPMAPSLTLVKP